MQSHLEAALLGQGSSTNHTNPHSMPGDEEEKEDAEEEVDDVDDLIDEECDNDTAQKSGKPSPANATAVSKTVTLQMLLDAKILQPGPGSMTIEYLGQKFTGDLLVDGKIRSQETDIIYASPSAWAVACKRFINPDKKSGCGWASVRYKGKKLDAYKSAWNKKKLDEFNKLKKEEQQSMPEIPIEIIEQSKNSKMNTAQPQYIQRIIVKHNTITNRTFTHDANTLIECIPFSSMGKIQPFLLTLSTNAALIMDLHSHLTASEVSGYLAGQWDVNAHNLHITHAFPCRNTKSDREKAPQVEAEIQKAIEKARLLLVGWYHSHPLIPPAPTLRDVDAQLDYQIRMKGLTDTSYTPCIGFILSPYNYENPTLESAITAYWVIPPPENKPNEYGRPTLMTYTVLQDTNLTSSLKEDITKCIDYYKAQKEIIRFTERYIPNITFAEKLKSSLLAKLPRDEVESAATWSFIRDLLGCPPEEESLLTIPNVPSISKPAQMLPPVSLNSNLMLGTDIASALFSAGKFPSTSSLLGLPDPMAQSTLAANNMFLQSNLFKMQELLKPLSTSSPITTPLKHKPTESLKMPTDLKKLDFTTNIDMLSLKNKLEYASNDLNLGLNPADLLKKHKIDFNPQDLNMPPTTSTKITQPLSSEKRDFTVADLSISSIAKQIEPSYPSTSTNFSLDLSSKKENLQVAAAETIGKLGISESSLDLSSFGARNLAEYAQQMANNFQLPSIGEDRSQGGKDSPMNLVSNN